MMGSLPPAYIFLQWDGHKKKPVLSFSFLPVHQILLFYFFEMVKGPWEKEVIFEWIAISETNQESAGLKVIFLFLLFLGFYTNRPGDARSEGGDFIPRNAPQISSHFTCFHPSRIRGNRMPLFDDGCLASIDRNTLRRYGQHIFIRCNQLAPQK
jgi:hypothetical protein